MLKIEAEIKKEEEMLNKKYNKKMMFEEMKHEHRGLLGKLKKYWT